MNQRFINWLNKRPDDDPIAILIALLFFGGLIVLFLLFIWSIVTGSWVVFGIVLLVYLVLINI